jgi:hypothetical protein
LTFRKEPAQRLDNVVPIKGVTERKDPLCFDVGKQQRSDMQPGDILYVDEENFINTQISSCFATL